MLGASTARIEGALLGLSRPAGGCGYSARQRDQEYEATESRTGKCGWIWPRTTVAGCQCRRYSCLMLGRAGLAVVTDVKAFRRACYEAARQTGGELIEFRISDGPTRTFTKRSSPPETAPSRWSASATPRFWHWPFLASSSSRKFVNRVRWPSSTFPS
jgi:hypothetical protein